LNYFWIQELAVTVIPLSVQGRIDQILSDNSEDRRKVFDEAAGIVKYKMRKREAEA